MAGVFGCARERDVNLLLREVFRLKESNALLERRTSY